MKISSMIRVSQEDKNVINYCPAELEYISLFLKTMMGICRKLHYKQSRRLCIWSLKKSHKTKNGGIFVPFRRVKAR